MNKGCGRGSALVQPPGPWVRTLHSASDREQAFLLPLLHSYSSAVHRPPCRQRDRKREKMIMILCQVWKTFLDVHGLLNKTKSPYLGTQGLHNMPPSIFPPLLTVSSHQTHQDSTTVTFSTDQVCQVRLQFCARYTFPPPFPQLTIFYSSSSASSALRDQIFHSDPLLFISQLQHMLCFPIILSLPAFRNGVAWRQNGQGIVQMGCKYTGMQSSCRQTFLL